MSDHDANGKLPCPHCGGRFTYLKTWRRHLHFKCKKAESARAELGPDNPADLEARNIEAGVITGAPLVWPDVNDGYGGRGRIHVSLTISSQNWWILPAGDFIAEDLTEGQTGEVTAIETALIDWRNKYLYLTRRATHAELGEAVATIIDRMTVKALSPVPAVRVIDAGRTLACGVCGRRYKNKPSVCIGNHLRDDHGFDQLQVCAALRDAGAARERSERQQTGCRKARDGR